MAIGADIRRLFGRWEGPVADLYRGFFVYLSQQVGQVQRWVPQAQSILEIGCGEGAVCERLAAAFPDADITGVDVTPRAGRLFRGDRSRVTFECATAAALAERQPGSFDLILLCDVLHHVPWDQHLELLRDARILLKPGGSIVVKEWELIRNVAHVLCELSDRVLTGDDVKFGTAGDFRALLEAAFGPGSVRAEARVGPWRNNLLLHAVPA